MIRHMLQIICLGLLVACSASSPAPPRALHSTPRGRIDTLPAKLHLEIWEAILRFYHAERSLTEADFVRRSGILAGKDYPPSVDERSPLILLTVRSGDERPLDSSWVGSLVSRDLVRRSCAAPTGELCGDSVLTTYLSLHDPVSWGKDTVVARVDEIALNPAHCGTAREFVGLSRRFWYVAWRMDRWVVLGFRTGIGRSGPCSARW